MYMYVFIFLVKFRYLSGHLLGKIAAHWASDMFSCLLIKFFPHLSFWSAILFLNSHFPDLCLLVPFHFVRAL